MSQAQERIRVQSTWKKPIAKSGTDALAEGQSASSTAPVVATERISPAGFKFRAQASDGARVDYYVPLEREAETRDALYHAGMKVESVSPRRAVRKKTARVPKRIELAQLAEQIGDMWEAGEPPTQILTTLGLSSPNQLLATALLNAAEDVRNGASVSEALLRQTTVTAMPNPIKREAALQAGKRGRPVFPTTLIHSLAIAEETGAIEDPVTGEKRGAMQVLMEMFAYAQTRMDALWSSVRGALMYPAAVVVVLVGVVAVMLYYALPKMKDMYEAMTNGEPLPLPTRVLIGASDVAVSSSGFIGGLLFMIGVCCIIAWGRTPQGKGWFASKSLWIPYFGVMMRETNMAMCARTLGMMASGSGDLIFALRETAKAMTNPAYREMLNSVRHEFEREARPLDVLFRPYTPLVTESFHTILVTYDRSGGLDKLCARFAAVLERRCERRVEALKHVLNTYLIIPLAVLAAGVLVALYAPFFDLVGKMSQAH